MNRVRPVGRDMTHDTQRAEPFIIMASEPPEVEQTIYIVARPFSVVRTIVIHGRRWTVLERLDPPGSTPTLVFMTEDETQYLQSFPSDWHTLSDEALYALNSRL